MYTRLSRLRPSLILFTFIFFSSITSSLAARHEREIDSWKPLNYNVTLTFNDKLNELASARAEITISTLKNNLSAVDLDFGEMMVDSVSVNNHSAQFEHRADLLKVELPRAAAAGARIVVVVVYHGKPKDGLIMTHDKTGKPAVVGDNWPNRVHHWIPCLDHPSAKATINFTVTAPTLDLVVANGHLDQVRTIAKNARTWSYSEKVPIPPYCMIIAVGQFARLEPIGKTITPLSYYVPQSDRAFALRGFAPAALSLMFFNETVAPYPYEKLALIVGATRFGGMENSSAIVFSNNLFDESADQPRSQVFGIREGLVTVVAHEIAHQWFGDSVTESTWSDLWLSEGFATYFAGLFIEKYEGKAPFREYMMKAAETYFRYEKQMRTPIHDTETADLFKLLNANNYQKGAWVLHMLRSQLGDRAFFHAIRAYYAAHKNSTANSEDFRAALEKESGLNLKEFFARWIYGSGHPQYELSWKWKNAERELLVSLRQLQAGPAFPNPLPIEIVTAGERRRAFINPTGKETIMHIPMDREPIELRLDPDYTVLKDIAVGAP